LGSDGRGEDKDGADAREVDVVEEEEDEALM
jgi:hypothetical protein